MPSRRLDPMLAIGYIRVSTREQDLGPAVQAEAIERWATQHGLRLVETFTDKGLSGGLDFEQRPGLVNALDALKVHRAGTLVAHKRDRVARDRAVIGNLSLMLRKMGARICTTERPPGAPGDLDPMERAMEGIQDVFAELERSLIRARTKAALDAKRQRGERIGTVPYGFTLAGDGIGLIEDPNEQELVLLVHELAEAGLSLRAIAAEVTQLGFTPKRGKKFYPETIRKILK